MKHQTRLSRIAAGLTIAVSASLLVACSAPAPEPEPKQVSGSIGESVEPRATGPCATPCISEPLEAMKIRDEGDSASRDSMEAMKIRDEGDSASRDSIPAPEPEPLHVNGLLGAPTLERRVSTIHSVARVQFTDTHDTDPFLLDVAVSECGPITGLTVATSVVIKYQRSYDAHRDAYLPGSEEVLGVTCDATNSITFIPDESQGGGDGIDR